MDSEKKVENSEQSENIINTSIKSEVLNTTSEKPKRGRKKLVLIMPVED